jgi:hypothetical protein
MATKRINNPKTHTEMHMQKAKYTLNTGLVRTAKAQEFSSDKEAWNALAKEMDANYKTGGHVIALLEKYEVPITNIHEKQGMEPEHALAKQFVAIGYTCFDWDGKPWNNPTYCKLCGCEIAPKLFRDCGYCKDCHPVINSLFAWDDHFHPRGMMHGGKRVKAKITEMQLSKLKEGNEEFWKDAMFLIKDGTLTLIESSSKMHIQEG